MSDSMGFGEGLASSPNRDTRCGRGKAGVAAQILLPCSLGVVVFIALVCDSRQYHGVDVLGQPIYPEILDPGTSRDTAATERDTISAVDTRLRTASWR